MRQTVASKRSALNFCKSRITPSTRTLATKPYSPGSRWMSDARRVAAWLSNPFTSSTIGPSSASSRKCARSPVLVVIFVFWEVTEAYRLSRSTARTILQLRGLPVWLEMIRKTSSAERDNRSQVQHTSWFCVDHKASPSCWHQVLCSCSVSSVSTICGSMADNSANLITGQLL